MRRIDLGCGDSKEDGFIGLDRFPLPGVDVVADLNRPLPFADDSIDLVVAFHSLEHVEDLLGTVKEIYRICRHGAQLCVVSPYSEQKLNLANPYHTCVFNEHTPRFWTPYPEAPIDPEEYAHPHARQWGLSRSDHSDPGIDIRLVGMEFFPFPQYVGTTPAELRRLRREAVDVCDQIMYHLLVWKSGTSVGDPDFEAAVAQFKPYLPYQVQRRKESEMELLTRHNGSELEQSRPSGESLEAEMATLQQTLRLADRQADRADELAFDLNRYHALIHEMRLALQQQRVSLTQSLEENLRLRSQVLNANNSLASATETHAHELSLLERSKSESETKLVVLSGQFAAERQLREEQARTAAEARADLLAAKSEIGQLLSLTARLQEQMAPLTADQARLRALQMGPEAPSILKARLAVTQAELETTTTVLALQRQKEAGLSEELEAAKRDVESATRESQRLATLWDSARRSLDRLTAEPRLAAPVPLLRLGGLLVGRDDARKGGPVEFGEIRKYSERQFRGAARASLVLTGDLRDIPYLEYPIRLNASGITRLRVAFRPLLPGSSGLVGVELVSPAMEIVAHVTMPLTGVAPSGEADFAMPSALSFDGKPWYLRIFVRDSIAPVQVYELERGGLIRGRTRHLPFVMFQ